MNYTLLLLACCTMIMACSTTSTTPNPTASPTPPQTQEDASLEELTSTPIQEIISPIEPVQTIPFAKVQAKYDTLIPILDKLFITHNGQYWGVIDSNGREIIPFVHDGVAPHSTAAELGQASIYQVSKSLNTGIPRFSYTGKLVYFNENGYLKKPGEMFSMTVVGLSDFYSPRLVLEQGPSFFLPEGEHLNKNY